jgi:hypothetical protein
MVWPGKLSEMLMVCGSGALEWEHVHPQLLYVRMLCYLPCVARCVILHISNPELDIDSQSHTSQMSSVAGSPGPFLPSVVPTVQ